METCDENVWDSNSFFALMVRIHFYPIFQVFLSDFMPLTLKKKTANISAQNGGNTTARLFLRHKTSISPNVEADITEIFSKSVSRISIPSFHTLSLSELNLKKNYFIINQLLLLTILLSPINWLCSIKGLCPFNFRNKNIF